MGNKNIKQDNNLSKKGLYVNDYSPKFSESYNVYDKAREHMKKLRAENSAEHAGKTTGGRAEHTEKKTGDKEKNIAGNTGKTAKSVTDESKNMDGVKGIPGMKDGTHKKKRIIICFIAVFGMGFFLSLLLMCGLGTDPCTFMNRSVSEKIGMSFGNYQLIINIVMLCVVIIFKRTLIGFGTLFNMVLIGYYADFFCWVWRKLIPLSVFSEPLSRWAIFIVSLICFCISAAIYINVDMGVSPYDGIPIIITERLKADRSPVSKAAVRILWDGSAIVVGMLAGKTPVIGVVLMTLFLGPVISIVGKLIKRKGRDDI